MKVLTYFKNYSSNKKIIIFALLLFFFLILWRFSQIVTSTKFYRFLLGLVLLNIILGFFNQLVRKKFKDYFEEKPWAWKLVDFFGFVILFSLLLWFTFFM